MFGQQYAAQLINRSASNEANRRSFLKAASLTGLGVVGAGVAAGSGIANAAPAKTEAAQHAAAIDDPTILNFALNLEYLEAEFYHYAAFGNGIEDSLRTGTGRQGKTNGVGHKVPWKNPTLYSAAQEIANDERAHVWFLRKNLGKYAVAFPDIDLKGSFTAAALAAGLIKPGQSFDPFASEANFLLGAFIFEDVGVTAYKGAAPLIQNKTYLEAAAGILAVEAYHAGAIRAWLNDAGLRDAATKISDARDSLDGPTDDDQGLYGSNGGINVTPVDGYGIAYSRTPQQVLNIVYLSPKQGVTKGGFFPSGMNGAVKTT